jgi:hypothetical protein
VHFGLKAASSVNDVPRDTGPIVLAPRGQITLPCVYCHQPIAAAAFSYWSATKRLLSASCPACQRRVTLTARTWRRDEGNTATG